MTSSVSKNTTLAGSVMSALARHGVRRAFGIPGGASSLDLLAACESSGIEFILTQTETAAVLMASVTGEMTATPGVVITAGCPGILSAVNGVAYAWLESCPLVLLADCKEESATAFSRYQQVDQAAILRPLTKDYVNLRPENGSAAIENAIALTLRAPQGPVHVEMSGAAARQIIQSDSDQTPADAVARTTQEPQSAALSPQPIRAARKLLAGASRVVLVVGLEAREPHITAAVRRWMAELGCPVLVTYKAKGVVPEHSPQFTGLFAGGKPEQDTLAAADLIILCGVDPVEVFPRPWTCQAPVLDLVPVARPPRGFEPAVQMAGPLELLLDSLAGAAAQQTWKAEALNELRTNFRQQIAFPDTGRLNPQQVTELTQSAVPACSRISIDSGAHMFPVLGAWQAAQPFDVLKSNGLSTMGYALPAAIAASLAEPDRLVVAFTGDGGLSMCLSELATAARHGCRIITVVLNDAALSLIDIKQQSRAQAPVGVRYPRTDFAAVARGFGCPAWQANDADSYTTALTAALGTDGPALIDAAIDPTGYAAQLRALRG